MGGTTGCVCFIFVFRIPENVFLAPNSLAWAQLAASTAQSRSLVPAWAHSFAVRAYCMGRDDRDRYLHNTVTAAYA